MKTELYRLQTKEWTIERLVYLVAGIFVILSVFLGFMYSQNWFYGTGFVGGMLIFFSVTGWCPVAIFVQKMYSLESLSENKKE